MVGVHRAVVTGRYDGGMMVVVKDDVAVVVFSVVGRVLLEDARANVDGDGDLGWPRSDWFVFVDLEVDVFDNPGSANFGRWLEYVDADFRPAEDGKRCFEFLKYLNFVLYCLVFSKQ